MLFVKPKMSWLALLVTIIMVTFLQPALASQNELLLATSNKACWKDAEARGPGKLPDQKTRICPSSLEKAGTFCYRKCPTGYSGFGPVCWEDCKRPFEFSSFALCCADAATCKEIVDDVKAKIPDELVKFAMDIINDHERRDFQKILAEFEDIVHDVVHLIFPKCDRQSNTLVHDIIELVEA